MTNQEQIITIESIFEGSEITMNDRHIYVAALDTNAAICIYVDTDNDFYTVTEMDDIDGFLSDYNTEEFFTFDDLIDTLENQYC